MKDGIFIADAWINDTKLSWQERFLLGYIYTMGGSHGSFYGSNKHLALQLHTTSGTISSVLSKLRKMGYLRIYGVEPPNIASRGIQAYIKPIEPPSPQPTWVYLMYNTRTGVYKIGHSRNPEYREGTLQSEEPAVELVFKVKASKTLERKLHKFFGHCRLRGEWFALTALEALSAKSIMSQNQL